MPSTSLGFPYPTGSNPTNVPGDLGALANSVESYAQDKVEPLWTEASDQKTLSSTQTPTSTSNINLTDLNMSVTSLDTSDVIWVRLDATVRINTAGTINIVELLVDGVAQTNQLTTELAASGRIAGHKEWRLTALSAGSHTLAFRTRNTAGSTSADVQGTHTTASYWKKA